ncbi:hypothetical protein LPICM17_480051 [Lactococcus piscium]|nr:hypothetical protein LPICM17_480051 [Lactococcus piscium]
MTPSISNRWCLVGEGYEKNILGMTLVYPIHLNLNLTELCYTKSIKN